MPADTSITSRRRPARPSTFWTCGRRGIASRRPSPISSTISGSWEGPTRRLSSRPSSGPGSERQESRRVEGYATRVCSETTRPRISLELPPLSPSPRTANFSFSREPRWKRRRRSSSTPGNVESAKVREPNNKDSERRANIFESARPGGIIIHTYAYIYVYVNIVCSVPCSDGEGGWEK